MANKLHLASKNLQNKYLITAGKGFGNKRAPKTHHTMRNSRRLARYKAHGFFLAPRRHRDALTKHAGRINYKMEWNGLGKQKNVLLLRIGLNKLLNVLDNATRHSENILCVGDLNCDILHPTNGDKPWDSIFRSY